MNTRDHYILARELSEKFDNFGEKNKRNMFIAGCVMPDINPLTYIKGHMFGDRCEFVEIHMKKIENKIKNLYAFYKTGIIIHYIGDCFTFPHNSRFKGSLEEHIKYENKLHNFINNDFSRFENKIKIPKINSVPELFKNLHKEYIQNKNSYENDCGFIYNACLEITGRLLLTQPESIFSLKVPKSLRFLEQKQISSECR